MEYLNDEEKELIRQNEEALEFVKARLFLENESTEAIQEYLSSILGIPPSEVKLKKEYKPLLAYDEFEGLENFIQQTPLAGYKIKVYSLYEVDLGTSVSEDKNGNPIDTRITVLVSNGNIYEESTTTTEDRSITRRRPKAKINLRIFYMYYDGDSVYVAYRIGNDRKTRIEEMSTAVNTIKSIYNLTVREGYYIRLYLEDIAPEFLKYDRPIDGAITINNGVVHVEYPEMNEKEILKALFDLYEITTQKEAFNLLALYTPVLPLNLELRKRDCIVHIPMLVGKAGTGKSALAKLFVVNGFANPDADRTEDNIYTKASFRELFSKNTLPILIDEITQPAMERIAGSLKSLSTGSGKHSRGRIGGGLNEWQVSSIPVFTSNEMVYIDSGIERRLIKIIMDTSEENDIALWRSYKKRIPDGFQYIIMKEMNGLNMDDFVDSIVKNVKKDEDYLREFEKFVLGIYQRLAEKYGLKCPFEVVEKPEAEDDDWYVAFGEFIIQNEQDALAGNRPYLKVGSDYEKIGDTYYVSKLGFQKFLKQFPRCPYRTASTFAMNSPEGEYKIEYKKKKVCGAKNPIHVISLKAVETVQVGIPTFEEQLRAKEKI